MNVNIKIAALSAALCLCAAASAAADEAQTGVKLMDSRSKHTQLNFYRDSKLFLLDDEEILADGEPFMIDYMNYLPLDSIIHNFDVTTGFNTELNSVVLSTDTDEAQIVLNSADYYLNGVRYVSDAPTLFHDGVFYLPITTLAQLTDVSIYVEESIVPSLYQRERLTPLSLIDDRHRLAGYKRFIQSNDIDLIDNRALEIVSPPEINATNYADALNMFAALMPESVNIYSILVPTSAQFYAPADLKPTQTEVINAAYERMDERINRVNVIPTLWEHADEPIYFQTDHHWTQRGAYYAYKRLLNHMGKDAPPLDSFIKADLEGFEGSLRDLYRVTGEEMPNETLERFLPSVNILSGRIYTDMYMQNYLYDTAPVNVDYNRYLTFIGGENVLVKFETDAPSGRTALVVQDSYGDPLSAWLTNEYSTVYVVDPRCCCGYFGDKIYFSLRDFYSFAPFDDLIFVNYAGSFSEDFHNMVRYIL